MLRGKLAWGCCLMFCKFFIFPLIFQMKSKIVPITLIAPMVPLAIASLFVLSSTLSLFASMSLSSDKWTVLPILMLPSLVL